MLTEFQVDWFDETSRWVDATLKTAADESLANAAQLAQWYRPGATRIVRAGAAGLAGPRARGAPSARRPAQPTSTPACPPASRLTLEGDPMHHRHADCPAPVFIALQTGESARAIVEAIVADNPRATSPSTRRW
jgi:hypothetical protein